MEISAEQRKKVKGEGFLSNNDGVHFSARIITENGVLTAKQLKNISEVADKYGNGDIAFTSRLTLEVPGINFEDIEAVKEYVAREGMETGGTGAKVRPVVACKGTVCTFGLIDTQALAKEIHRRFYKGYRAVALPHKFKIAVGGCPNNCVKPELNDLGIVGQRVPVLDVEACRGCGKCSIVQTCPVGAAKVTEGKLVIDPAVCNNCGRCAQVCYFKALTHQEAGYKVYVGGRWGKKIRHGTALKTIFTSKEEVLDIIEKAILLFKDQGKPGERFATLVERLGMEQVEKQLLADDLLQRKEEILGGSGAC
ncbi:4Fe-4S binding protein [Luoshenia tenuis]|jgi:dissimilatory sulfite reductase (desulfoviridin) alpha/beta subunit|uniref:4Fe-4S binding protein n=1 Tax=Luoshenia tenuis TaxID=2763654 RepID=UPI003D920902